jgi:glutathione synthase
MQKILFIIDKVELKYFEFNKLVTNFWLIKEFLERGNEVFITTNSGLALKNTEPVSKCYQSFFKGGNIYYEKELLEKNINSFDLVMFRPDPPVDIDYINATYIFDFVRTKVINSPKAIRDFNEKLHSLYFKDFMTDVLVTSSLDDIEAFLDSKTQIVLKPLNRCFGSGVMYLYKGDPNTRTIINTLTNNQTTLTMIQEFIPEVKDGDTRVLTLGDKILPYSIKKLPSNDDFKFNTHNDDFLCVSELSREQLEYFEPVARKLNSLGIVMAGLDVIDQKIIEVNVTSPCYFIKEINNIYKVQIEKILADFLLTQCLLSV